MDLQEKLASITDELGVQRADVFNDILRLNKQVTPRKPVYTHRLEPVENKVTLIPLADMHLGHRESLREKVAEAVEMILRTPGCYTVILGDAVENATKVSVGLGIYEEDMHLRDQMHLLVDLLRPLVDAGRLLGIHTGNHEFRSSILLGINPMELIASQLNVPYLDYQGFHQILVGEQEYQMMSTHGVGCGRTTGSKVNSVERMADVAPLMDLFIAGHTHIRHTHDDVRYVMQGGKLIPMKRYYVICGSFISYFGGYPEMKVLSPSSTGVTMIEFYADQHNIRVSI